MKKTLDAREFLMLKMAMVYAIANFDDLLSAFEHQDDPEMVELISVVPRFGDGISRRVHFKEKESGDLKTRGGEWAQTASPTEEEFSQAMDSTLLTLKAGDTE